jgi:hypothetical protein
VYPQAANNPIQDTFIHTGAEVFTDNSSSEVDYDASGNVRVGRDCQQDCVQLTVF